MCSREDLHNLQIVVDLLEVMEVTEAVTTMVTTKVVMEEGVEAMLESLVHPDTDPEELWAGNLKEQATIITNPWYLEVIPTQAKLDCKSLWHRWDKYLPKCWPGINLPMWVGDPHHPRFTPIMFPMGVVIMVITILNKDLWFKKRLLLTMMMLVPLVQAPVQILMIPMLTNCQPEKPMEELDCLMFPMIESGLVDISIKDLWAIKMGMVLLVGTLVGMGILLVNMFPKDIV